MNVKSVEKEKGSAKVVVEIDKAEFNDALGKAYAKCRKNIMIPGFRKGKAPRKVVESMYGATVFYEDAINEIFPEIYAQAIEAQQLKAVGTPSVADMDTDENGNVVLTVSTELYPEVTLGAYKGIEVPKAAVSVSKAEVDAELNRMAERNARIETVDREAKTGDTVVLDFEGFVDGKPFDGGKAEGYTLTLGSGALIDGFEDGVCGMQPGEEKQLDLVFPADYNPAFAGKAAVFTVKLNHIYPVPNDAIAVQYWNAESLDAYRATLRAELEGEAQAAFEVSKEEAAWTKALANSRVIRYPESALNEAFESNVRAYEELAAMYNMTYEEIFPTFYGLSVADAETILFNSAKNLTAQRLLLYAVSKDMGLDVSDEKFEAELAATAAVLGLDSVDTLVAQLGKSKTALKEDKLYDAVITKITAEAQFVVTGS